MSRSTRRPVYANSATPQTQRNAPGWSRGVSGSGPRRGGPRCRSRSLGHMAWAACESSMPPALANASCALLCDQPNGFVKRQPPTAPRPIPSGAVLPCHARNRDVGSLGPGLRIARWRRRRWATRRSWRAPRSLRPGRFFLRQLPRQVDAATSGCRHENHAKTPLVGTKTKAKWPNRRSVRILPCTNAEVNRFVTRNWGGHVTVSPTRAGAA
jgi:hypothetical protein